MNTLVLLLISIFPATVDTSTVGFEILDLRSIICAWSVDVNENLFVKYKCSYVDQHGRVLEKGQTELTHVLYGGMISVKKSIVGNLDWFSTWKDGTAVAWEETIGSGRHTYNLRRDLLPGDSARLGFIFDGFIGMDTDIQFASFDFPSLADRVLSVSQEEEEISVYIRPAGSQGEQQYNVVVFSAIDHRMRRLEYWNKMDNDDEPTKRVMTEYLQWKPVDGQMRPSSFVVTFGSSVTKYEITEMRSSVESDLEVMPQSSDGDIISDKRLGFVGIIGSKNFTLDGISYRSKHPITGPLLNLEILLSNLSSYSEAEHSITHQSDIELNEGSWIRVTLISSAIFIVISGFVWLRRIRFVST